MAGFLNEILDVITDLLRLARDRRLSWRLVTRDHVYQVRNGDLWFWTRAWQRAEDEAKADLRAGRYADFNTIEALAAALAEPSADAVLSALRRLPPGETR